MTAEATRMIPFDPEKHPHAPAGSPAGGQFTASSGGGGKPKPAAAKPKQGTGSKAKQGMGPKPDPNVLSYDPDSNRGTGYGRKGGDPRVKQLQEVLNRLGLLDLHGDKLDVDGKLGPLTTSAVKKAQRRLGVAQDGKVTPALLRQLADAKTLPVSKRARRFDEGALLSSLRADAKPYGDVQYADVGYQADGKARYPIDSPEHVRAAWSYINQEDNAAKYTPAQLKRIKSRIMAAGRKYGIQFSDDMDAMARTADVDGEFRRVLPSTQTRAFDFELRSAGGDGRTLEGYVAVFGATARIADHGGDFDEEIHRGAFDRSLSRSLPVMQFDHGRDSRTGTVPIGIYKRFAPDSRGYEVNGRLFRNPVVEPVREAIAEGAITGMSWRMMVTPKTGDRWTSRSGQVDKRDVFDADVPEAGPVVFPAYDATTVSVRSLLAGFSGEERAALVRELAAEVRLAVDLAPAADRRHTDLTRRPARGAGGGDRETPAGQRGVTHLSPMDPNTRDRVLKAFGVLTHG